MYNLTLVQMKNITYGSLIWDILVYSAFFNSSAYENSTQIFGFKADSNVDYYYFMHPNYQIFCPSSTNGNIVDCQCNCSEPIIGVTVSYGYGCQCNFDHSQLGSLECTVLISCSVPGNASLIDHYSYDSQGYFYMNKNYSFNSIENTCYQKYNQYMISCKFNVLIGTINYNVTESSSVIDYYMSDTGVFQTTGEGVIVKQNTTNQVNATYSVVDTFEVCQIPSQDSENVMSFFNGSNEVLLQLSYICLAVKCPQPNTTYNCTTVTSANQAVNQDYITGSTVTYSCDISNDLCQTPYTVIECMDNGEWNSTAPVEICSTGNWSDWNTTNCTLITWDQDPVNNTWQLVYINLTLQECYDLDPNQIQAQIDVIINTRNQNTQASLNSIHEGLTQTLNQLDEKYRVTTQIANTGSIIAGVFTIAFILFIISGDIMSIVRLIVNSNFCRRLFDKFEMRQMRQEEMEARWSRSDISNRVVTANAAASSGEMPRANGEAKSSVPLRANQTKATTRVFVIADNDPKIRVKRTFKPVGNQERKTYKLNNQITVIDV